MVGLTVGAAARVVGLGDVVGDTGAVVDVAGTEGARLGWSSEPIGLTGPPELWGSVNSCCDRVVDDEEPSTIASATMLVTSIPIAAPAATAGATRDTRSRIHSE